jgi:multiple sugar transport system ATP-binding protein
VRATTEVIEPMGAEVFLYLNTGLHTFIARVDAHETADVNQKLDMVFNTRKSHFFDATTEKMIV